MKLNSKFKAQKSKFQRGYTLIELLAVMMVMATVGVIIAGILVSSLRGSSKTTAIDEVRMNGNSTIIQISKMIKFAQNFNGVSSDGTTYTTNCTLSPSPQYRFVKITSFDDKQTVFSCNPSSSPPNIASNGASLINTDKITVDTCYFTCLQDNLSGPQTIRINFTLSQKNTGFFEKRASISFETSVVVRNLNE